MLRLRVRALAIDLGPGIGIIDLYVLDRPAWHNLDAAPGIAAVFQPEKDFVLDLHVPRIVVLAGLDHGARRRHGITAALHLDGIEMRPVWHVIERIALAFDQVARFEVDKPIGARPDRLEVCRRFARWGAL